MSNATKAKAKVTKAKVEETKVEKANIYNLNNNLKLKILLKKTKQKHNTPIWSLIEDNLKKSKNHPPINLSKIDRLSVDGQTIMALGKVLSSGSITNKNINIVAYDFSVKALDKIEESGSKAFNIEDFIKINPTGKGVKILG